MSADLHCHSVCSDGGTSVKNIVRLASLKGLTTIALTDHDTFKGVEEAKFYGKKYGVDIVHGAEISAYDFNRGRLVHLLCFNCKKPELFDDIFKTISNSRKSAMINAMDIISQHYAINMEMVEELAVESTTVFKSHIMKALMIAGYTDKVYGELYQKLFNWKTGIARTNIDYPDVKVIIDLIHQAQGVAVLAHPEVYDTIPAIPQLIEMGIDGIECDYPRSTPEGKEKLLDYINKYNLLRTGGTDFHGYSSGCINPIGTCTTSKENLNKLLNYKR